MILRGETGCVCHDETMIMIDRRAVEMFVLLYLSNNYPHALLNMKRWIANIST
jgi:hypothetical protein